MPFWEDAKRKLQTWKFVSSEGTVIKRQPRCLTGWITSITGIEFVWRTLQSTGFAFLETRALNQDPLENLFGSVRANCGSNVNPTVPQFVGALKTCIINDLSFKDFHLQGTNCENDDARLLSNLRTFLDRSESSQITQERDGYNTNDVHIGVGKQAEWAKRTEEAVRNAQADVLSTAFVSGFIAKHILRNSCNVCKMLLTEEPNEFLHADISMSEYCEDKRSLTYPSELLVISVCQASTLMKEILDAKPQTRKMKQYIIGVLRRNVDFSWVNCEGGCVLHKDEIVDGIIEGVFQISIRWWCKLQNRRITGSKGKYAK
jgi:hypothetical protein